MSSAAALKLEQDLFDQYAADRAAILDGLGQAIEDLVRLMTDHPYITVNVDEVSDPT